MTGAMVNFGVIGTGRMAATMAAAIRNTRRGAVVAVCSMAEKRARDFADRHLITAAYGDLGAFCANPDIQIVYVANAARNHAESAIAALRAGKSVLCEKPLALSHSDAQQIVLEAERSGAFFMEAMWLLLLPSYQEMASMVRRATFGNPVHLGFSFGFPVAEAERARLTDEADGGSLFDRACYGVSLALSLLGETNSVAASRHGETHVLQLRHVQGSFSQIAVSSDTLLTNTVSVGCERGTIGLDAPSLGAESLWRRNARIASSYGEPGDWRSRFRQVPALRRLRSWLGPRRSWLPYGADQYQPMLSHVIDCLEEGRTCSDIVPSSLSTATVRVLEQARMLEAAV